MGVYFITFRSVTPAQRAELLLRRNGHYCVLQRTPRWMEEQGCGYCLRMQTDRIETAMQLLRENGIGYRKVYRQNAGGTVEVTKV